MGTPYRDSMPFTIDQIVALLGLTVKREKPNEWMVNCPFCLGKNGQPDRHGHMSIDLLRDRYRCHRCGRMGGKLQLYMECRPGVIDTKQAYREILEELEGSRPSGPSSPIPQPVERPPSVESNRRASPEELHKAYSALISMLTLTSVHRQNLRDRGLSGEEIDRLQYRSVPAVGQRKLASKLLTAGCVLEGVPGFYLDEEDHWTLNTGLPGIIMPERDEQGRIHGLQVRKDNATRDKCYWFTGREKKSGVPHSCIVHFANVEIAKQTGVAYLTEGIMKADISAFLSKRCFLAIAGVSHFSAVANAIPTLKRLGLKRIMMAFDMDMYENSSVSECFCKISTLLRDAGFEVMQITWERYQDGLDLKGIDDYLKPKIAVV